MVKHSPLSKILCDLVSIPSINPSLDQDNIGCGEEPVTAYLEDLSQKAGLRTNRQKVIPGRDNLMVYLSPMKKPKQRIFLAPHLDVVPASMEAFSPKISKGRLYGRGACDTKASVACFFQAILNLSLSTNRPTQTEIIFVGLVDEEFTQSGSRAFARKGPKGNLAIVGEPTGLQVVTAHKGSLWLQLETHGKAAHGSTPEKGENAILRMHHALEILFNEYSVLLSCKNHPLLGSPTLSVGKILGGSQPNVVPNRCTVDLDRRTIPGESIDSVIKELKDLFRPLGNRAPKFKVSRSVPCPPLHTDSSIPNVQMLLRKAGRRKACGVPYFTDASPLSAGGTPSVVFGPGNIAQAHAENEWVDLHQVERAHSIILNFLKELP
jgi:acetylornithine deacetylase/succinyl-diaminopimelate desuccinylase-like protein